ncbi:MAG: hypothetical protein RLO81_08595 [Fulvivirga sp.]|uniref:hypothetical protein n=1 Tax=Fulvivirga sp. TaxID=1931237 RepID=UPI0032F0988A
MYIFLHFINAMTSLHYSKNFAKVLACSSILIVTSCNLYDNNQTVIYNGRIEVLGKSYDESLQDSVLIVGSVYSAVDNITPEINARIWSEKIVFETFSNANGEYELKLPPGSYDIKCKKRFGNSDFIEKLSGIELLANEKFEVNFFLGV